MDNQLLKSKKCNVIKKGGKMGFLSVMKNIVIYGAVTLAVIAAVYFTFVRPWIMRMGTTREEVKMSMAGDGLVEEPNQKYTQAITINAPKDIVWAYLIQSGYKRGGWYNLDFINRLADKNYFYENNKSADRIIPELQNLKEGDKIAIAPMMPAFDVSELKKEESMLLAGKDGEKYTVTWSYMLRGIDKNTTRLYVRWESNTGDGFMAKVINTLLEPGTAGIQQSQNLRGIKKRAEAEYLKMGK